MSRSSAKRTQLTPEARARLRRRKLADELYEAFTSAPAMDWGKAGFMVTSSPLVPLIRCVVDPPCEKCWYCEQARKR
jgi:hypothetical protein